MNHKLETEVEVQATRLQKLADTIRELKAFRQEAETKQFEDVKSRLAQEKRFSELFSLFSLYADVDGALSDRMDALSKRLDSFLVVQETFSLRLRELESKVNEMNVWIQVLRDNKAMPF